MTAPGLSANPTLPRGVGAAPDRTGLLLLFFIVTSSLLLVSHNSGLVDKLGGFGTLLKNPIVEAFVVSLFLANVLFAYLWRAAPWAKALVDRAVHRRQHTLQRQRWPPSRVCPSCRVRALAHRTHCRLSLSSTICG